MSTSSRPTDPELDELVAELVAVLRAIASWAMERLADRLAERVAERAAPASPWMTTQQAAEYSGLAESTFEKLASRGHWRRHRHAKGFLYDRDELDEDLRRGPASRSPTREPRDRPSVKRRSRDPPRS